jgi:Holliday junction DNA helicase RuvA
MIARLKGTLIEKSADKAVVDVSGVGYEVGISLITFYDLPEPGSPVSLHVHTHVREDALSLFGFLKKEEKQLFEQLITVSKIGPRIALNILSRIPFHELKSAIRKSDLGRLTSLPGVGAKTAERLVVELRDKMGIEPAVETEATSLLPTDGVARDAVSALVNLGYKRSEAEKAVTQACRDKSAEPKLEEILKHALTVLSPG